MPVPSTSDLKTVSVVLTQEQVQRLRAMKAIQSSKLRKVSFSDVCREVVEVGLDSLSLAFNSRLGTNTETMDEAA